MKLLEEKTHLDPIYISFHADQHNRMNSVLQYSSFREEKNQNERSTRSPLLLHSINDIFFFPTSLCAALKARVLFQITQHLLEK